MYKLVTEQCGNTLVSEVLAFKLHREVLNFEDEADSSIFILK